jgi:hypothetical protein
LSPAQVVVGTALLTLALASIVVRLLTTTANRPL